MEQNVQKAEQMKYRLADAMKQCMAKMPIERITVRQLVELSGTTRQTFYRHFQDKYEVVERIIKDEILQPIRPLLQNDMIDESMILIFSNLQKEKEFYTKLAKTTGQNSFEEIVRKCVEELLLEFMISKTGEKVVKDRWLTPAMIAKYYAQSMTFVVMNWIQSGMLLSPKEIAEVYDYIITRSMQDIIDELKE